MITSLYPLEIMFASALSAILLASTAKTRFAPARAASSESIPVPQPTSITTAPRKSVGVYRMNVAEVLVRTRSVSIVQWIAVGAVQYHEQIRRVLAVPCSL